MFGALWIDSDEKRAAMRDKVPHEFKGNFDEFVEKGYTIFRGAVEPELADQVREEIDQFADHPTRYVLKRLGKYVDPVDHKGLVPGDRVVDIYGISKAARKAVYPKSIGAFISFIFGEPAIAMQSISFPYGSQQAIHQDTAYVISEKPLSLAASWLALEDVTPGTGELVYYPGSHRFDHYLFSGEHKNWMQNRDGQEQHQEFLSRLHEQAKAKNIQQESFIAKKGDVLVWHADLAHGGARITLPGRTRKSLVTHFCPQSVKPVYRKHIPKQYFELDNGEGQYFTSRHYDLRALKDGAEMAPILYDGGITKNRKP